MRSSRVPLLYLAVTAFLALLPLRLTAGPAATAPTLVINELGKGTAPLDGKWQFHLGDDPLWAEPATDDTTGQNGWEEITADAPWGQQGHNGYSGIAWYRRHIEVSPAQGAPPDAALQLRTIDDAYELYWNGVLIGGTGKFPPHPHGTLGAPPSTYGLGPIHSGVLAIRVWRGPPASNEDGSVGGLRFPPILGSPQAIAALHDQGMFRWLRARQFAFGLDFLYTLVALISLVAWLRNRSQWLFFWMTVYAISPAIELLLQGMGLPIRLDLATMLVQMQIQIREISQWFVLLFLLQLDDSKTLRKLLTWLAVFTLIGGTLDGTLAFFYDTASAATIQWTDAVLTSLILPQESIPAILVAYALFRRKKLDSARWVVAIFATSAALNYAISNVSQQGVRFTHWPLADWMSANLFTINGNNFNAQLILRTLLFLAILYSVTRYAIDHSRRQAALEQEFQNARALQQVLIPETLPELPGYAVTSSYRPAQEVGGDFFQILELDGADIGSTLIVIGDVSGKGLKAAMTVALIVGVAYLMNYSGLTYTLGLGVASAGLLFPLLSPFLGWIAVFLSGSDTSGNALFGNLQVVAANQLGLNPVLIAATNSSGGVMGKMISPQNIATGVSVTDLKGQEGVVFARTFKHSIVLTLLLGGLVLIQQYVVPWMIPH